jgi:hypothetical protein
MSEIMYKFSGDAVKVDGQMLACALLVWFIVLGCALSSVLTQPFSKKQRTFWAFVVLGLPLLGLLAYLPFSIRKENYPGLFNSKK